MVVVSYSGKEINAKLVYYGAGLCGKTTNLEAIYEAVPETSRGKMVSMKTQSDRTLFFDLLPLDLGEIMGFKTRFLLYTVPGQVFYNATRKLVLKGADAIVFVADSAVGKMDENLESLQNLRQNLSDYGLRLEDMPWVLQYNKRDLPNVYSIDELNASLNPAGHVPVFEAVAFQGTGVFETFRGISHLLMQKVTRELHRSPQGAAAARAARNNAAQAKAAAQKAAATPPPVAPVAPAEPAAPAASEPASILDGQRFVDFSQAAPPAMTSPPMTSPPSIPDPMAAPEGLERIGPPTASVAEEREAPSLAFEIDRGTPPPAEESSHVAKTPSSAIRREREEASFGDEPPGLASGRPQPLREPERERVPAPQGSEKYEERTLALAETATATVSAPVAESEPGRHEVAIPISIPAGEAREIVLRITIRAIP